MAFTGFYGPNNLKYQDHHLAAAGSRRASWQSLWRAQRQNPHRPQGNHTVGLLENDRYVNDLWACVFSATRGLSFKTKVWWHHEAAWDHGSWSLLQHTPSTDYWLVILRCLDFITIYFSIYILSDGHQGATAPVIQLRSGNIFLNL